MQIDGAIITEQGVTFGIAIVKPSAIQTSVDINRTRSQLQAISIFQGIPLILASQDSSGRFTYQGRQDIVDFLRKIDASRIPWKRYTVS